ncbi:MAG: AtpZ/AtpI family protein [Planctomycetota bacterium]
MSSEAAAGAGIGWLIDRGLGTAPRWLTIGGLAGIVVGMTSFLRAAFRLSRTGKRPSPPPAGPASAAEGDVDDDDSHHG